MRAYLYAAKVIHLELISELPTDVFVAALKGQIGTRELPNVKYCNSTTNFIGGNNTLQELKKLVFDPSTQRIVEQICSDKLIESKFILLRAPHFGPLLMVKGHLGRSLVNERATFDAVNSCLKIV